MFTLSTKIQNRIKTSLKKFKVILKDALKHDYNESDTVTIVKDLFEELFGYEKYEDLTSEYRIKNTYCDVALKIDDEVKVLVEVKAAGITLKERHSKQAVDYAVNLGVEWVVLTNAIDWHVYNIEYKKPVDQKLIIRFNLLEMNLSSKKNYNILYALSKEGVKKDCLSIMKENELLTSKFIFGAILCSPTMIFQIKKALYELQKNIDLSVSDKHYKIEDETILETLRNEVIRRDITEAEELHTAMKIVNKARKASLKKRKNAASKKPPASQSKPKPMSPPLSKTAAFVIDLLDNTGSD